MTVSITNPVSDPFAGNGATTSFPFDFKAMAADEVQVLQSVAGAAPTVVSDADYTVTLNATEGGTVTFGTAPATGTDITIVSNPSFVQDISFTNAGAFLPQSHDEASDREAIRDIYLKEQVGRAIKAPVGESIDELPVSSDRAGQFFAFDADGNPVAASGTGADAGLRADLAANSGFTLIKYKNADANAYGRSGAQLKALGAEDSDGLSFIHFVNPNEDDALIAGAGVSALDTSFTNALANLSAVQASTGRRTRLLLPQFEFPVADQIEWNVPDLMVDGPTAKITSATASGAGFFFTAPRMVFNGVWLSLTDIGVDAYFNVTGTDITFIRPKLSRSATGGVAFYVQGPNCHIIGGSSSMYGGYICDVASGFQLVGHTMNNSGGDDNIALKAVNGSTDGVLIANNTFNGGAAMVSFGSELGTLGANDSTHSKYVRNVQVLGNQGFGCANILYAKPGAVLPPDPVDYPTYDYRDGLVEHVVCSDNILEDSTGALFNRGVAITVGRGAIVRHVTGKNNQVRARALNSGVNLVGAIHIIAEDLRAASPTSSAPTIDHIDVQVLFSDPYDGVASGGSAPGEPVSSIAFVEKDTVGWGIVSNITIDVTGNGCVSSGIIVGSDLDDSVFIRRAVLSNIGASGSTNDCGIKTASKVKVGSEIYYTGTASRAYKIDSGGLIVGNVDHVLASKDTVAGTDSTARAVRWAASRSCFVHKVEIVNSTNIAHSANDTDYTQHEIRNEDVASAVNSVNSALTGGVALPSGAFNAIYDAVNLSGGNLTDCFYTRGQRLSYTKNDFGTGNALTDAVLRIHWAPF